MMRNSERQYGAVAVLLHWLTAVAVATLVALGIASSYLPDGPDKFVVLNLHKAVGFALWLLVMFRWLWTLINTTPGPLPEHGKREILIIRLMRWSLLSLLLLLPLVGLLATMHEGHKLDFFGMFYLQPWVAESPSDAEFYGSIHEFMANTLIALVLLHILFALRRHLLVGDDTLQRILGKIYS